MTTQEDPIHRPVSCGIDAVTALDGDSLDGHRAVYACARRRRSDDEAAGTMDRVVTAKRSLYMRVRACMGVAGCASKLPVFSKE